MFSPTFVCYLLLLYHVHMEYYSSFITDFKYIHENMTYNSRDLKTRVRICRTMHQFSTPVIQHIM